jgi:hypothetical protein
MIAPEYEHKSALPLINHSNCLTMIVSFLIDEIKELIYRLDQEEPSKAQLTALAKLSPEELEAKKLRLLNELGHPDTYPYHEG